MGRGTGTCRPQETWWHLQRLMLGPVSHRLLPLAGEEPGAEAALAAPTWPPCPHSHTALLSTPRARPDHRDRVLTLSLPRVSECKQGHSTSHAGGQPAPAWRRPGWLPPPDLARQAQQGGVTGEAAPPRAGGEGPAAALALPGVESSASRAPQAPRCPPADPLPSSELPYPPAVHSSRPRVCSKLSSQVMPLPCAKSPRGRSHLKARLRGACVLHLPSRCV